MAAYKWTIVKLNELRTSLDVPIEIFVFPTKTNPISIDGHSVSMNEFDQILEQIVQYLKNLLLDANQLIDISFSESH